MTQDLGSQIDEALSALERALADAGNRAEAVRSAAFQVTALEQRLTQLTGRINELESAVARARESLSLPGPAPAASEQPYLRPVPQPEPAQTQEPEDAFGTAVELETEPPAKEHSSTANCLKLDVTKKVGSLDLKQVDGAVSEVPAVIDVTLIDYDGRQATLKLWLSEGEDTDAIRETLLKSLRSRIGGEAIAEIQVEVDQDQAA
jgi:hypothetical protein